MSLGVKIRPFPLTLQLQLLFNYFVVVKLSS